MVRPVFVLDFTTTKLMESHPPLWLAENQAANVSVGENAKRNSGGRDRDRTGDPLLAKQIQAKVETCGFWLTLIDSC